MADNKLAKFEPSRIFFYVESPEEFPVPFDGLWQKVGYSRKDSGVEQLKRELIEGIDFISSENRNRRSGKASSVFYLTADAAKVFAVRARTPEGVELAKLFVAAYNELKAKYQELKTQHEALFVWQQNRLRGKSARRSLTDAIQEYVDCLRSREFSCLWAQSKAIGRRFADSPI